MTRDIPAACLFTLCLLGASSSITPVSGEGERTAQTPLKAAASVELIPGASSVIVTIRNLSDTVVDAWAFRLTYDLGSGPAWMDVTLDAALAPDALLGGAIQPHMTRTRICALPGIPVTASATVQLLMFSDGGFEESTEHRDSVLRARERRVETLSLWIEALQTVSGLSGLEAKLALQRIRQTDKRYAPDPTDAFALATNLNIEELLTSGDATRLPDRLSALLQKFKTQRERGLLHKGR